MSANRGFPLTSETKTVLFFGGHFEVHVLRLDLGHVFLITFKETKEGGIRCTRSNLLFQGEGRAVTDCRRTDTIMRK